MFIILVSVVVLVVASVVVLVVASVLVIDNNNFNSGDANSSARSW